MENGHSIPETNTISTENSIQNEIEDKDIISDGPGSIALYDQWVAPLISGLRPKARYEVPTCHVHELPFFLLLFFFSLSWEPHSHLNPFLLFINSMERQSFKTKCTFMGEITMAVT